MKMWSSSLHKIATILKQKHGKHIERWSCDINHTSKSSQQERTQHHRISRLLPGDNHPWCHSSFDRAEALFFLHKCRLFQQAVAFRVYLPSVSTTNHYEVLGFVWKARRCKINRKLMEDQSNALGKLLLKTHVVLMSCFQRVGGSAPSASRYSSG